ncbi:MAG: hypothetical protein A3A86_03145 [Elusimicrobia bacterium RIFCSPLOWO2_01_FULL_60_11]|nr:MAG: hypothetical protein A2636_05775 [Elusimicrobia bacterium RIFCSPHIGHO2_01_FULL_64_10]OGR85951.1 MAG: hypothetical protein A3A86_03145 [Elusimicrobia bacterium RIFCSPLOWO2_01_FULL_60_11]
MTRGYSPAALFSWILFCGFLTFSFSACAKKQVVKPEDKLEEEEVESEELDIHGKDFVESKNLSPIFFDYDSSSLSDEARKVLAGNAAYLKKSPDLEVLTEGHCDKRGTIGYNLALGQRRAASVRLYYVSLGIEAGRAGSLSYGKEKPLCIEDSEDCWAQNRRVQTKVRAKSEPKKEDAASPADMEEAPKPTRP